MRNAIRSAGALVLAAAVLTLGISTPASAQTDDVVPHRDDVEQVVDNMPATAEALADGLQATIDTAMETQSAVETSDVLVRAVVVSGNALVAHTERLEGLGIALWMVERDVRFALDDYLGVIDGTHDPADLLTVQDVRTMTDNAEPALEYAVEGGKTATIQALRGHLLGYFWVDPLEGGAVGTIVDVVINPKTAGVVLILTWGTNLQEESLALMFVVDASRFATGSVLGDGYGGTLIEAGESLAPLFEAAQPATGPIIDLLEGL